MIDLNGIAQVAVERMAGSVVEGLLLTAFAILLLRVLRQNSGTRFAVWLAVMVGTAGLAIPLGSLRAGSEAVTRAAITVPSAWALYLFSVWAVIAGAGLVRVGAGLWQLRRLRKSCVPVDPASLSDPLRGVVAQRLGGGRSAILCTSERIQAPTAMGFFNPVIAIPSWLMNEISAAELDQILLHEMAHLRRWDDWTNLLQKVVKALLFFHPAVWWLEQRISLEREMACDDAVLAETANPQAYARCLVFLAERSLLRRGIALAQAAVSRMRDTSLRVTRILEGNTPLAFRRWKMALSMVTMLAGISLVSTEHTQIVAFKDKPVFAFPSSHLMATARTIPARLTQHTPPAVPVRAFTKPLPTTTPPKAVNVRTTKPQPRQTDVYALMGPDDPQSGPSNLQPARQSGSVVTYRETYVMFVESPQGIYPVWQITLWQVTLPASHPELSHKSI